MDGTTKTCHIGRSIHHETSHVVLALNRLNDPLTVIGRFDMWRKDCADPERKYSSAT